MSRDPRPLIAVMGPTASGKTALAMALVDRFPCDIVSVDSAQVYRGMDRGTAKPSVEELRRAPHRLIDLRDPWQPYSAAEFVDDAVAACEAIWTTGRTPLLVGGTTLYFRALEHGLSPLPSADPQVRAAIAELAAESGWPALHEELSRIDPKAAGRIEPGDAQRIQRALEVHRLTGRPISELQSGGEPPMDARWFKLVVCPAERAVLHRRIEARFREMLANGLIEEVEGLRRDSRIHAGLPALRAVGYRQVWKHLDGAYDRDELERRGVYATRQLAKRQLTALRKDPEAFWIDPETSAWIDRAADRIAHFLDTCV